MGGQHRAHQRAVEEGAEPLGLDARLAYPVKGEGERAGAGSGAGERMRAIAADVMLVLGDVREMGEIAEGAHNRQGLVGAEAVEHRLELAPRAELVVAVEANRRLADLLDERVGLLALLLAHRVAEDAAEQTDVVPQRAVFWRRRPSALGRVRRPCGASPGERLMLACGRQWSKQSKLEARRRDGRRGGDAPFFFFFPPPPPPPQRSRAMSPVGDGRRPGRLASAPL